MPSQLVITGNMKENWKRFKQNFEIFMIATGGDLKESKVKAAILLNLIGEEANDLYNTLNVKTDETKMYEQIIKAFDQHCATEDNVVYERFVFMHRKQQDGEPFEKFLVDLKKLVKSCEFGDLSDSLVRDVIVYNTNDDKLRDLLLTTKKLKLENCIEICRLAEVNRVQSKELSEAATGGSVKFEVDAVKDRDEIPKVKGFNKYHQNRFGRNHQRHQNHSGNQVTSCYYCLGTHKKGECPGYGKTCGNCGFRNHLTKACRRKLVNYVNLTGAVESESDGEDFIVDMVQTGNTHTQFSNDNQSNNVINSQPCSKSWVEKVKLEDKYVNFKIDTGAEVNILPYKIFKRINQQFKIQKTKNRLEVYGGGKMIPFGIVSLICNYKNKSLLTDFYITDCDAQPLLSLNTCESLGIIQRVHTVNVCQSTSEFIENNREVFEGIGCFRQKCKLSVREGTIPSAKPPRRVPIKIMKPLKQTLDEMERQGIITKSQTPTEWVHNMVIVEKPNKSLRICLDPKHLNHALKQHFYQIPTLEDLTFKLAGSEFFTVLDLKDGFWQIELEDDSKDLCTFSTPMGCYRFERVPMGLNIAPELFQKYNEQNFGDIEGVFIYIDDILIATKTEEEHSVVLKKVLDRAKELNIKFNPNKIQLKVKKVKYYGQVFSKDGVEPNKDRTKAITDMELPKSPKELQRYLGMINYMRNYLPNLSEITAPLRDLLKKNVVWQWLKVHSDSVNEIKKLIANVTCLAIYDEKKPLIMETDASMSGIGYCIKQDRAIAFGSRCLTDNEKNWGIIEKEFLAILVAADRFKNYVYGRKVIVHTDHRPLVSIMKNEICKINSTRLQRIRIKLLKYDLDVQYIPGKKMIVADHLSRSYLKNETGKDTSSLNEIIHSINVTDNSLEMIKNATKKDCVLSAIQHYYEIGWPQDKSKVPENLRQFWKIRNEIHVENDVVFRDERVFVPRSLRSQMLATLHVGHAGITKSKKRANGIMFWPGISSDIEDYVSQCKSCCRFRNSNIKEPMIAHPIPEHPFNKISADICEYGGLFYLMITDFFSKWIDVVPIKNKTAGEVIQKLKIFFSNFGIANTLIADNNPFNSFEFKTFSQQWNFQISTSSPRYAKSNGAAEKAVQTGKNMIKKCIDSGSDLYMGLLEYRNTPAAGLSKSPAEIVFGRQSRSKFYVSPKLLENQNNSAIIKELQHIEDTRKKYYDKTAVHRDEFTKNQHIWFQRNNKQWTPGKIIDKHSAPRSYMIQDDNGRVLRRNSFHIRKDLNKHHSNFNQNTTNRIQQPSDTKIFYQRNQQLNEDITNEPVNPQPPASTEVMPRISKSGRRIIAPDRLGNNWK